LKSTEDALLFWVPFISAVVLVFRLVSNKKPQMKKKLILLSVLVAAICSAVTINVHNWKKNTWKAKVPDDSFLHNS